MCGVDMNDQDNSTGHDQVFELDASVRLSWELVKILRSLHAHQQREVLEFAKSLMAASRTEGLSGR
ncbi:MAG: hypothetical protein EOP23_12490 [Hyphomicrobiales bacterium]|nr:MAG: hypothetical protein EOP23_12490 [Hyphomicrobiales bacterium]